jgi:hypothetical protein
MRVIDVWSQGYREQNERALAWWSALPNPTGEVWVAIDDLGRALDSGQNFLGAFNTLPHWDLPNRRIGSLRDFYYPVVGAGHDLWLTTSLFPVALSSGEYHDERDPMPLGKEVEVQKALAALVPAAVREISNEPFSGGPGRYSVADYQEKIDRVAPVIRSIDNSCEIVATYHPELRYPDAVTGVGFHIFESAGISPEAQAQIAGELARAARSTGRRVYMDETSWVGSWPGTLFSERGAQKVKLMTEALIAEGVSGIGAWMCMPPFDWGATWDIAFYHPNGEKSLGATAFGDALRDEEAELRQAITKLWRQLRRFRKRNVKGVDIGSMPIEELRPFARSLRRRLRRTENRLEDLL